MDPAELFDDDDAFIMTTEAAAEFLSIGSELVISRNETANSSVASIVSNFSTNGRHLTPFLQVVVVAIINQYQTIRLHVLSIQLLLHGLSLENAYLYRRLRLSARPATQQLFFLLKAINLVGELFSSSCS